MNQLMTDCFLPPDYEQQLFQLYHDSSQETEITHDYRTEFLWLTYSNDLREMEDQHVDRFLNSLKPLICDKIGLKVVYTFKQTNNLAM